MSETPELLDQSTDGRIIACFLPSSSHTLLWREARREARRRKLKLSAVAIEVAGREMTVKQKAALQRTLDKARRSGAETAFLSGESYAGAMKAFLETIETPQLLLVGAGDDSAFSSWEHPGAREEILRAGEDAGIEVRIVEYTAGTEESSVLHVFLSRFRPMHLLYSVFTVAMALGIVLLLEKILPPGILRINDENAGMIFIIACAFAAGRFGLVAGLLASCLSFFIMRYYFVLSAYDPGAGPAAETLDLLLFLATALIISFFASKTRSDANNAVRRELNTQALFTLYRVAANATSRAQALESLQRRLSEMIHSEVAFFLPPTLNPARIEIACPRHIVLGDAETGALEKSWNDRIITGAQTDICPASSWRFAPMMTLGGQVGVLGIRPHRRTPRDLLSGSMMGDIASQTASVLEHLELNRSMEASRIQEEREKLRSMLLSSVSHDLKTPLASIIGALSIYRSPQLTLGEDKRRELIDTALQETERLDSFITNILDITHLESGKVVFKHEWHNIRDLVKQVARRIEHRLRDHTVVIHPVEGNVEVFMDVMITEQALQNIIDNAGKYTPAGTRIEITCGADAQRGFYCEVRDHGGGLPPEKLEKIFDKYARIQKQDSQVAGTGLGLAISKAMMEGQGGSVIAGNHPEGGALFTLSLPKWREAGLERNVA